MKITDIKTIQLKYPYEKMIADGLSCCGGRGAFLIIVETDTELRGLGESATFGASMQAMAEIVETQLKPLLVGENPAMIEKLWMKMTWNNFANGRRGLVKAAISGIDIALWDLLGKMSGLPISQLLGAVTDKVQGYASAGFYAEEKSLEDLQREIEGYLKKGYSAFKMKVGRTSKNWKMPLQFMQQGDYLYTKEFDEKRVEAVHSMLEKDDIFMLDMNCTWNIEDVLDAEDFFTENNIYMIEEPIRNDDIAGYTRLSSELKHVRVAGCESEQGLDRYKQLLEASAVDVVQANLGWSGGFTECTKIAALSQAWNKLFTPHTFFSAVLTAANVQFASTQYNVPFIESEENFNPLRTDLLKTPIECDEKMNYIVPQRPGLGVELNWDVVNRYAVK